MLVKNFVSRTMGDRELPSDSDESDEDYVPSGMYNIDVHFSLNI